MTLIDEFHPNRQWALFLDVDGTLLDIAEAPGAVCVPHELRNSLRRISETLNGAVALVSGRSIVELDRLFAPLRLPASGRHGSEVRLEPCGDIDELDVPSVSDDLREEVISIVNRYHEVFLEDKRTSLAIHYRKIPAVEYELGHQLRHALCVHEQGYRLMPGRMVWEIAPVACSKGSAVRTLMTQERFRSRVPVFVGDDVTDEDGFVAVQGLNGVALVVAGEGYAFRPPTFNSPAEVRQWLHMLPERLGA